MAAYQIYFKGPAILAGFFMLPAKNSLPLKISKLNDQYHTYIERAGITLPDINLP